MYTKNQIISDQNNGTITFRKREKIEENGECVRNCQSLTYQKKGGVEKPTLPLGCFDGLESEGEDELVEEDEDVDEPAKGDVDDKEMGQHTYTQ